MNTPLLSLRDVTLRFGGLTAVHRVSFDVAKGGITALIGPNGAGKTTLFNCITGFYKPDTGAIFLERPEGRINLRQLLGESFVVADWADPQKLINKGYYRLFGGSHQVARAGVARTFQNIRLFQRMTVMENLLVAQHRFLHRNLAAGVLRTPAFRRAENLAVAKAAEWLDFFGLLADANRLAGELPYGRQRRLEMARALCTDPCLLCLDEPAAGLNPRETEELSQQILRLKEERGITLLMIEHDMSLVMGISEQVVVLDHGEVIARGNPAMVRKDPMVLAAYLGEETP